MTLPLWFSKLTSVIIISLSGLAGILIFIVMGFLYGWPLYVTDDKIVDEKIVGVLDVANWVTLTSEIGVGILIALIIYVITHFQQQESRKILNRLDLSLKFREVKVISQITGSMKFIVRMLDSIQFEIDSKKGFLDIASDKRMTRYREVVRDLCKNLRKTDITDLPSLEINRQLHSVVTGLEIYVDHWDDSWDVLESNIFDDIGALLDLLISKTDSLETKN